MTTAGRRWRWDVLRCSCGACFRCQLQDYGYDALFSWNQHIRLYTADSLLQTHVLIFALIGLYVGWSSSVLSLFWELLLPLGVVPLLFAQACVAAYCRILWLDLKAHVGEKTDGRQLSLTRELFFESMEIQEDYSDWCRKLRPRRMRDLQHQIALASYLGLLGALLSVRSEVPFSATLRYGLLAQFSAIFTIRWGLWRQLSDNQGSLVNLGLGMYCHAVVLYLTWAGDIDSNLSWLATDKIHPGTQLVITGGDCCLEVLSRMMFMALHICIFPVETRHQALQAIDVLVTIALHHSLRNSDNEAVIPAKPLATEVGGSPEITAAATVSTNADWFASLATFCRVLLVPCVLTAQVAYAVKYRRSCGRIRRYVSAAAADENVFIFRN